MKIIEHQILREGKEYHNISKGNEKIGGHPIAGWLQSSKNSCFNPELYTNPHHYSNMKEK